MSHEFINRDTGEIVEIASYRTPAQQEAYLAKKQREAVIKRAGSPFVFTEMDAFKGGISMLNNKDLGYFLLMQTYVDYKNMVKAYADAKTPMSVNDIAEVLDVTTKTVANLLNKLEKLSIIHREKVEVSGKRYKAVFINSDYCFRKGVGAEFSNKKTDKAVKVFFNSLQEAYKQGLQPADIGFIYKTIQFIHYDTNLLVVNPSEKVIDSVQTLSLEALADVMQLSIEETSRKIGNLQWNGMFVYGKIRVGRELMIKANPYLLYRKAGDFKDTLGAEFKVNKCNAI
jgi:predicted transcriptional regulator